MDAKGIVRAPVLIVLLTLLITACTATASEVPIVPTAPQSTDTPIPIEIFTPEPADTATPDSSFLKFPPANCCRGRNIDPGKYELPAWLDIPLTIEIGEDWRVLNEQPALLFLIGRGRNVQDNPSQMIVFSNVTDKLAPEALIDSIQMAPELISTTEPVDVTIAGFPGLQLDSTAKPNPSYEGSDQADIPPGVQFLPVFMQYLAPGFAWTTSSPEAKIRTIVLTVENQTLLLYLESPPDEFDDFAGDAELLLQSMELTGR